MPLNEFAIDLYVVFTRVTLVIVALQTSWVLLEGSKFFNGACSPLSLQPMEVYVDDDSKLTLHGLQQHYVKLKDNEKNRKLFELLDALEFNQVR